jgi:predicted GNAT superfamily acetyltransferase
VTVTFRDLHGMEEFLAAEAMQTAVWGQGDKVDPADLMMVIAQEGGLAGGAFEYDRLLGYVFAFPTVTPGVQHSHRLAVLPQARNLGLGSRLKWYQRDWCLVRGIGHIRWTFDPLRRTNAILNIARLGAQVTTYLPDYYGAMEGINKGTASDRLLADWYLDAPDVSARAGGKRNGVPLDAGNVTRVGIHPDFASLLDHDAIAARSERLRVRAELQSAFAAGRVIKGFDPDTSNYMLV